MANNLAKTAALSAPPRNFKLPFADIFPSIRNAVQSHWQQRWESFQLTNKKMRALTPSSLPWHYASMPRRWETALCRLWIGHTRLTHGHLMSADPQTYYMDCLIPLTVEHLLAEWPSLGDERRLFLSYGKIGARYQLTKILGQDEVFNMSGIFGFLTRCGVLNRI